MEALLMLKKTDKHGVFKLVGSSLISDEKIAIMEDPTYIIAGIPEGGALAHAPVHKDMTKEELLGQCYKVVREDMVISIDDTSELVTVECAERRLNESISAMLGTLGGDTPITLQDDKE